MSSNNILLNALVEPALPAEISMWPATLGWKVLLLIGIVFAAFLIVKKLQAWRRNRYRRDALNALLVVESLSKTQALTHINQVLKQACCTAYGAKSVASLHNSSWLEFLDHTSPNDFITPITQQWQIALYDPTASEKITANDLLQLTQLSRYWLQQHEVNHD